MRSAVRWSLVTGKHYFARIHQCRTDIIAQARVICARLYDKATFRYATGDSCYPSTPSCIYQPDASPACIRYVHTQRPETGGEAGTSAAECRRTAGFATIGYDVGAGLPSSIQRACPPINILHLIFDPFPPYTPSPTLAEPNIPAALHPRHVGVRAPKSDGRDGDDRARYATHTAIAPAVAAHAPPPGAHRAQTRSATADSERCVPKSVLYYTPES